MTYKQLVMMLCDEEVGGRLVIEVEGKKVEETSAVKTTNKSSGHHPYPLHFSRNAAPSKPSERPAHGSRDALEPTMFTLVSVSHEGS
jgi:hypothetical protein